jgi:hypothetical protein
MNIEFDVCIIANNAFGSGQNICNCDFKIPSDLENLPAIFYRSYNTLQR